MATVGATAIVRTAAIVGTAAIVRTVATMATVATVGTVARVGTMGTVAIMGTAAVPASAAAPSAADTWRWPASGDVLTDFANAGGPYADGQHRGIDVGAPAGTPVVAAVGGTVRFSGLAGSSGLTVSVRTTDGRFDTSYLHLATTSVRSGEAVGAGERIGAVGRTGRTRRYRDPLDFLPPLPGVREAPRGVPVAVRGPVRVGPAPQPVRPHRFAVASRQPSPAAAPSRAGWAIACGALIAAATLAGDATRRRRARAAADPLPSFGGH